MTIVSRAWRLFACAGVLAFVACAISRPMQSMAADPVNLEGTWKIASPQTSFKPEGGAVPFTASGRREYQENKRKRAKRDFDPYDLMIARCSSPGAARLMLTPDRFRIWQRPGLTEIQFEWNRLLRQIDMGGLIPQTRTGPGGLPLGGDDEAAVGRAIPVAKGHWEGDTLVATTQGFSASMLVDDLVPHGDQLRMTERIRLRNHDTLEDRFTFEDPKTFTRPWESVVVYKRQPDGAFPENVCLDTLEPRQ
jgi:hypothetical protein